MYAQGLHSIALHYTHSTTHATITPANFMSYIAASI
jgi:hypothetical protein